MEAMLQHTSKQSENGARWAESRKQGLTHRKKAIAQKENYPKKLNCIIIN